MFATYSSSLCESHSFLKMNTCSYFGATIKSLNDAVLPAANWVLQLLYNFDGLKDSTKAGL